MHGGLKGGKNAKKNPRSFTVLLAKSHYSLSALLARDGILFVLAGPSLHNGLPWPAFHSAGAPLHLGTTCSDDFCAERLIFVQRPAGVILIWRFGAPRAASEEAERRAQKLIALSFYLIAVLLLAGGEGEAQMRGRRLLLRIEMGFWRRRR